MFADYQDLVVAEYRQKKDDPDFPLNLREPKPARLREACIQVCRERFDRRDLRVIRDFFGQGGDRKECLQAIQQVVIDRFRPLINYLNGETSNTDEKNIELLAWLIDFPLRPYDYTKKYEAPEQAGDEAAVHGGVQIKVETEGSAETAEDLNQRPVVREVEPVVGEFIEKPAAVEGTEVNGRSDSFGVENDVVPWNQMEHLNAIDGSSTGDQDNVLAGDETVLVTERALPERSYRRWLAVAILLLAAGGAGLFWWWDNRQPNVFSTNYSGGCMYWAGDHYQPVACNQKIPNARIVALDSIKIKSFRKINRPDTITNRAKGWVWYSKINGQVEFYTADGEHPVVYGRRLKPITDYMIDKYVRPDMSADK